jgi:hypothetical protein
MVAILAVGVASPKGVRASKQTNTNMAIAAKAKASDVPIPSAARKTTQP